VRDAQIRQSDAKIDDGPRKERPKGEGGEAATGTRVSALEWFLYGRRKSGGKYPTAGDSSPINNLTSLC
jgi:hypothetical protein